MNSQRGVEVVHAMFPSMNWIRHSARWLSFCFLSAIVLSPFLYGQVNHVVISEVYGGGGNSGSTYKNDFIELYNRGETNVTFSNWSVQYASASGSSWQVTTISGAIAKGGYFLVQEAAGAGGTTNLPAPDGIGSIAMSSSEGKVALVKSTTALNVACPTAGTFADFVGYGSGYSPSCATVTEIAKLSNTLAGLRNGAGCAVDFATGAANPRNTAQPPTAVCSACSDY
jgi:hypothetical protein